MFQSLNGEEHKKLRRLF
ncbi:MAG: hypothetical protein ACLS7Y_02525 [Thomasclavelia spiroformis]